MTHSNSFVSLLVLLLIFPNIDSHSYLMVSTAWPNDFTSVTVNRKINSNTSKDTNELEWASRVGKINSNTSNIIRSGSRYH
jgi:hypothetical protein